MKKIFQTLLQASPLLIIALLVAPNFAQAHLIGGNGMMTGLTHPLFGPDHLLAMVAVGIISAQLGGKAIWKVPASFLTFMVLGGVLGMTGLSMPIAEIGIATSVMALGIFIALSKKIPLRWAVACVAVFALFHGHAHGAEMPSLAHPTLYALGFLVSTAALHITGVLMGYYAKKTQFRLGMLRYAGVGMTMLGISFLLGF